MTTRQVEREVMSVTNGQLMALLEAIRIINEKSDDKADLDKQIVRIQVSIDKEKTT